MVLTPARRRSARRNPLSSRPFTTHYRARSYDPRTGRFVQRDPLVFQRFHTAYEYVRNLPTSLIDPSGQIDIDVAPKYTRRSIRMAESEIRDIQAGRVAGRKKHFLATVGAQVAVMPNGEKIFAVEVDPNKKDLVTLIAQEEASDANDILAEGIEDLISKLRKKVKESGEQITSLRFFGHSQGPNMDVGGNDETLNIRTLEAIRTKHKDIADLFAKDARVAYYGCNCGTGEGPEGGQSFLAATADTFLSRRGGSVSGYSGYIRYLEGLWGENIFSPEEGRWVRAEVQAGKRAVVVSEAEETRRDDAAGGPWGTPWIGP